MQSGLLEKWIGMEKIQSSYDVTKNVWYILWGDHDNTRETNLLAFTFISLAFAWQGQETSEQNFESIVCIKSATGKKL